MIVRLANSKEDIKQLQRLRYNVWVEEFKIKNNSPCIIDERVVDEFDYISDHLLIIEKEEVIGTVRLLRQEIANKNIGFFASQDFNLHPLLTKLSHKNFLELDWICTHKNYRGKHVIEKLYHGILAYIKHYNITAVFGRASFYTTDVDSVTDQLNLIFSEACVEPDLNVHAHDGKSIEIKRKILLKEDHRKTFISLPPFVKGILSFGTKFCSDAVFDLSLGTIDVIGIVTDDFKFDERYVKHFWSKQYDTDIPVDLFS